ncbi:MAG: alpha/beta fold hydrolase [Candidatus Shapirobacteria bacterium]|nr:alpha/beta fold hydrolase [Candidatus Shapirobacteria bacterium]
MNKYIFLSIVFLFFNISPVFGIDYFHDNFDYKDNTKWNYIQNPDYVVYSDGMVNLEMDYGSYVYPLIISNNNIFDKNNDWVANVRFKYRSTSYFGDGIGVGFTNSGGNLYYQFGIWNDLENGSHFYYNDFSQRTENCTNFNNIFDTIGRNYVMLNFSDDQWHNFIIKKTSERYEIYLDENKIYETAENQCVPTHLWFGNKESGGSGSWSLLSVDDVKVESNFDYLEESDKKLIIIPGFGASWNSEAIVYNRNVDNNQWVMTPFVRNYDGLIKAMEDNSLEINKDFYVWNYDWRKPLVEIVDNLNIFINQKISSNEKVVLVGHSLGGLVSRIWAENNKDDSRLEKVITLGSPHLGSVDAYEAWNGGQISDLSDFSSIALKVLLKLQGLTTRTDMEAVRTYTPSVKDLLPTFSFLKKDGLFLSNDQLETKNDYLINQNNLNLGDQLNLDLFVGKGYETTDSIKLKKNTIFDRILGLWPDGKIDKFLYTNNGDGTVLVKSANYDKNNFIEVDSKHGEIVGKTINQVMLGIGLSEVNITSDFDDYKDSLVVFVGSPVNYSVKCDDEPQVLENNGFVIIKNNNYNFCTINLVGNNDGLIHLVVGNTNDNNWFYWEKNITNGEINNIKINPKNGQVIEDNDNISFLRSIIRDDINSLLILNKNNKDLKLALKFLEKNQPKILIKNIFDFRQRNNEKNISQKIIDNTTLWLSIIENCSKNKAISGFKKIDNYQNLINKLVSLKYRNIFKISENSAISYKEMERLLEFNKKKINDNDYFGVCANNFTAMNYGSETLKISHKNDYKKWLLEDSNL